ncbi:MAG: flagellar hook-associated protein FlgL [Sandarakinorhabdus sp.]|nr:flagellar hook-associated protein FlgL [Sandarakinorhabdus sp.]
MPSPVYVNSRSPIPVQAERMGRLEDRLAQLDRQISTGTRLTEPAEDPAAANRAAMLARLDSRLIAEERSLQRAASRLALSETAIGTAGEALLRARELALTAANGTFSADDRQAITREVQVLRAQLLDSANARDESGRYLFAGSRNAGAPFAPDGDDVVQWRGFSQAPGAEAAGIGTAMPPRGPEAFGDAATGAFAQLKALEAALAEPDAELRNAALAGVLEGLESGHNRLTTAQAGIGAGLARLENEGVRISAARLDAAAALAAVTGLDLTAAFAELQALQLTLSAAQTSFSRIHGNSLFDRLG